MPEEYSVMMFDLECLGLHDSADFCLILPEGGEGHLCGYQHLEAGCQVAVTLGRSARGERSPDLGLNWPSLTYLKPGARLHRGPIASFSRRHGASFPTRAK